MTSRTTCGIMATISRLVRGVLDKVPGAGSKLVIQRHPANNADLPNINDPDKVCYLILYLMAPSRSFRESDRDLPPAFLRNAGDALGISLHTAYLTDGPPVRADLSAYRIVI